MGGDGLVRQVAGGDDVRQQRTGCAAGAQALGQVDFHKAAMAAAQPAERVERLHHARALGPAAADAAGQRYHRHAPLASASSPVAAIVLRDTRRSVRQVAGLDVFECRSRPANGSAPGRCGRHADRLESARAATRVETVSLEQRAPGCRASAVFASRGRAAAGGRTAAAPCRANSGSVAAGGGEAVQLGAARGRKQARLRCAAAAARPAV